MNILLSILFSTLYSISPQITDIEVNVDVDCDSRNIKNKILSEFRTELRSKSQISISDDEPLFYISVQTKEIQSPDDDIIGIVMSVILTRRVKVENDGYSYELIYSSLNLVNPDDLEQFCSQIVSNFDVNYFEDERN